MPTQLTPYLAFRDTAREALDFYRSVFGGECTVSTFGEFGVGGPAEKDRLMHGQLIAANGMLLMASDRPDDIPLESENSISLSLSGDDADELTAYFAGLSEGGAVGVPLEKAPWGDSFGMVTDRYGIHWMVNIAGEAA
ncbi:VOC family protein [Frigoribacterium sp. CFBP9030]|uniref:VOC family protein n=1 Tax=Frigoribacterium sp. CFBP9030 TaxID=3096537 RepID=UPI002A69EA4C|nr:VOC family protein [Frigoribacterium sp. CFBP9030]MDY0892401.1 VOC family protein [Frigoribacterium sp. CFBP9030]